MAAVAEKAIGSDDPFTHRQSPAEAEAEAEREYRRDVKDLVDLLSKLNPSAKEFFPSSYAASGDAADGHRKFDGRLSADAPIFVSWNDFYYNSELIDNNGGTKSSIDGSSNDQPNRRRRNGYNVGKRRANNRPRGAERDDSIRRTVYVSDIDQLVTEENLAELFSNCGPVVDCRICGDPRSVLRFAFIEFSDEDGARAALNLGGTMLGYYPVRVLPSKTAILPVNPKFLPKSEDEKKMVVKTVYCTNIDKKITQTDIKNFFEQFCGEVFRLRLLGDNVHSTCIAFVEFVQAESAIMALNCSGTILGDLPIRVSPSKTPVRPRVPRAASNGFGFPNN
ncbi:hypothetical protein OPV22_025776 [Ensete ventricosum]|uniref:RRM domain-containing protein n=1 Tax=Ensete ventricosum TaxID=4639 RepID=A0AAV8QDK6_ENSVE|nr:hypothetical protein OPV22_025776 [Ensete ventricosum]